MYYCISVYCTPISKVLNYCIRRALYFISNRKKELNCVKNPSTSNNNLCFGALSDHSWTGHCLNNSVSKEDRELEKRYRSESVQANGPSMLFRADPENNGSQIALPCPQHKCCPYKYVLDSLPQCFRRTASLHASSFQCKHM